MNLKAFLSGYLNKEAGPVIDDPVFSLLPLTDPLSNKQVTYPNGKSPKDIGVAPADEPWSDVVNGAVGDRFNWLRQAANDYGSRYPTVPPEQRLAVRKVIAKQLADENANFDKAIEKQDKDLVKDYATKATLPLWMVGGPVAGTKVFPWLGANFNNIMRAAALAQAAKSSYNVSNALMTGKPVLKPGAQAALDVTGAAMFGPLKPAASLAPEVAEVVPSLGKRLLTGLKTTGKAGANVGSYNVAQSSINQLPSQTMGTAHKVTK